MASPTKFTVYKDDEQWLPFFKWFWTAPNDPTPDNMGHGAYPARWIAWLSGWWHTR